MKYCFFPLLYGAAFTFAAEANPPAAMVGVLMDAHCQTIAAETSGRTGAHGTIEAENKAKQRRSAKAEGTRARVSRDADPYENCKATPDTTVFALATDGQLYLLDEAANQLVRSQVRNESFRASMVDEKGAARWLTVTVEGRPDGERLSVISMRR